MNADQENIIKIKDQFPLDKVNEILNSFKNKKVLVIGDTILDEYCFVEPKGRAMKDPMLSVNHIADEIYAGGILAIANHISNFVNEITILTLLGDNLDKKDLIVKKLNGNIKTNFFEKKKSPTIRKRRYISKLRHEKLFKIEYMNDSPITYELEKDLIDFLEKELPNYDLVVVGDFGHGFINKKLIELLETKSKFLSVNAQTNSANLGFNHITRYNSPSFITMDGSEIKYALGERGEDFNVLINKLSEQTNFKKILVTLGKGGVIYSEKGVISKCPAFVSKTTDVVGAGDAVFSITSLLASSQVGKELIPFLANCVGGIAVNIMGNERSINKEELSLFVEKKYKEVEELVIHDYFASINDTLGTLDKTSVSNVVKLMLETYNKGGVIYAFGNGGSAATASHFCGDLVKGVSYGLDKRFKAICLNDNIPALMAIANDISYDDIFLEQLKNFLSENDLIVGISGSGNSINVVKALEYAKDKGVKTVAICGFKGGKIKEIADLTIHAEVDDMEISEDIHNLIIVHCVKRALTKELDNTNLGEEYEKRVAQK